MLIGACTGGDDESSGNSKATAIDTPTAGARYAAVATDFFDIGDNVSAKSASHSKFRKQRISQRLGSANAKTAQSEDCELGGSYSIDRETGRSEYQNCKYTWANQAEYTATETINGVEFYLCADSVGGGSAWSNDCMDEYVEIFGENGAPITFDFQDSDGEDSQYGDLYTDRYRAFEIGNNEGYGFESTYNGRSFYQDRVIMSRPATFTFNNLRLIEKSYFNGRHDFDISGTLGSDLGEFIEGCPNGSATYNTVVPISISGGALTAGELTITNEKGDTAHLVVDDGEFLITVNGVSESFSASELEDICD